MADVIPKLTTSSLFNVANKIVLITGGSSGIGKMMAAGFVQNGAKVYIAARKEAQLQQAVKDLEASKGPNGGSVHYIVANVGSKAGTDALISAFLSLESKIHVLVNNSGITWGAKFEEFPEKGWDNVMNVNVKSIFYLSAGLAPLLEKDATSLDPGRIINISSTSSLSAVSENEMSDKGNGVWSYSVSKAAVNHLTAQLAVTLGQRNITVNAILPGVFPSKMTTFAFSKNKDTLTKHQPNGRFGIPQDAAGIALFLASPASAHVTNAHIVVDGGAMISKL